MSSQEAIHTDSHTEEPRSKTAMSASFWFVIILVGLFIATVNFVSVMSNESGEHTTTEASSTHGAHSEEAAH